MFGKKLHDLREQRGMTLRQLGEKAGMDYITLNKVELGLRLPPALEHIIALADVLQLSPEEFEELLDAAAEDNGKAGARFTSDELERLKESEIANAFFTRRTRDKKDE